MTRRGRYPAEIRAGRSRHQRGRGLLPARRLASESLLHAAQMAMYRDKLCAYQPIDWVAARRARGGRPASRDAIHTRSKGGGSQGAGSSAP